MNMTPAMRARVRTAAQRLLSDLWDKQVLADPALAALVLAAVLADVCHRHRLDYEAHARVGRDVLRDLEDGVDAC